ncbi:hypothetical protein [Nitrosomonas sp. wSCUT-2]
MQFYSIVEVNETEKLNAAIGAVFKASFAVPHIYQGRMTRSLCRWFEGD